MLGVQLLDRWVEMVRTGEQVASQNVKLGVERHLRDLQDAALPYVFDRALADRAIRLAQTFYVTKPRRVQVELHPFQAFVIGSIFGWVQRDRPTKRRFTKVLTFTARKSGKSWLAGAIAIIYWLFEEMNAAQVEVFAIANTKEQAKEIYSAVRGIIEATPGLSNFFDLRYVGKIVSRQQKDSYLKPVARSDKGLNDGSFPSCVLVDEFHASENDRHVGELVRGMVSRENPLEVYASTAGLLTSGFPLYEMVRHCERVLRGETKDERFFAILFSLDSPEEVSDPACWAKANPRMDADMADWLAAQIATAMGTGTSLDDILIKNMNMFSASSTRVFSEHVWQGCAERYDLQEVTQYDAYVGVDIGRTHDTCAFVALAYGPGDVLRIYYHCIVPAGTWELMRQGMANTENLLAGGCVQVSENTTITDEEILAAWDAFTARFNVLAVGYDRYFMDAILAPMQDAVGLGPQDFTSMPQNISAQNIAISNLRTYAAQRKLLHPDDRFLDWQLSNAQVKQNLGHALFIEKPAKNGYRKIDLVDALFSAITLILREIEL